MDLLGGVDVVVDNVGGQTSAHGEILAMTDDDWFGDLSSNLMSAVRLDRELVPHMVARGSGVVVHISSGAARLPQPGGSSYAAAKAAMSAVLRRMAGADGEADVEQVRRGLVEQFSIPAGRLGAITDIGYAVAFLASPAGRYVTGAQLVVDGGLMPTL